MYMWKTYTPKELWDYERAYTYALKILSQRACSTGKLRKRLSVKTSPEVVDKIIDTLIQNEMLNDNQLCFDSATQWIQKKPISRTQLYKKLLGYGFCASDINLVCASIEKKFENRDFEIIGGFSVDTLIEIYHNLFNTSIWDALMLASCVQMCMINNNDLNSTTIKGRLKLKGYNHSSVLNEIIEAAISKSAIDNL